MNLLQLQRNINRGMFTTQVKKNHATILRIPYTLIFKSELVRKKLNFIKFFMRV